MPHFDLHATFIPTLLPYFSHLCYYRINARFFCQICEFSGSTFKIFLSPATPISTAALIFPPYFYWFLLTISLFYWLFTDYFTQNANNNKLLTPLTNTNVINRNFETAFQRSLTFFFRLRRHFESWVMFINLNSALIEKFLFVKYD